MTRSISIFDGSTFNEIPVNLIISAVYTNNGKSASDDLLISFSREILDTADSPDYKKEIKLTIDGVDVFGGRIDKPVSEYPVYTVRCFSYGDIALDRYVNEIFEDKTPEFIVQYVVENYTDLTYASTVTTGITVSGTIVFKDKTAAEVIAQMEELVDYVFYTDASKNAFFEQNGVTSSGITLEVGNQVIQKPRWDYNPDFVFTSVIVEGADQEFDTDEDSFTASGGETETTLTYEPSGGVQLKINGTLQNPTVDGSTDGDYTLDVENKKITYDTALTGSDDVDIFYNYKVPVRVSRTANVKDPYGNQIIKEKIIKNKSIKTFDTARRYAQQFISLHQTPAKNTKLLIEGYLGANTGQTAQVIDSLESIGEELEITKIEYDFVTNFTQYTVGTNDFIFFDWQSSVNQRLREIERDNNNTDIIQLNPSIIEELSVTFTQSKKLYNIDKNNSWIWEEATWGTNDFGDRRDGDDFKSYSGSYTLSNYWNTSGTVSVVDNQLSVGSAASATYKGRDGTNQFNAQDFKTNITYEKGSSTKMRLFFRYQDANDNYFLECNHSNNSIKVKKTVSSSVSDVATGSFTYSTSDTFTVRMFGTSILVHSPTESLISTTDSSITSTGTFRIEADTAAVLVDEIKFFTGVAQ